MTVLGKIAKRQRRKKRKSKQKEKRDSVRSEKRKMNPEKENPKLCFLLNLAESKQSKASPSLSKAFEANDRSTDPTLSTLATSEDIDVTVVD